MTTPQDPTRIARPPIWLLLMVTSSGSFAMHIVLPSLPVIASDLASRPGLAQLTITLYLIGLASGQLIYGPLSDRFGRRPTLQVALVLFCLGSLLALFAPTMPVLLAARVLQSLGGCGGLVLGRAIVRDAAGPERAANQIALLNLVLSVSPGAAPVLGGFLTIWFGWRSIFAVLVIYGLVTLALATWVLPETNVTKASSPRAAFASFPGLLKNPLFMLYWIGGTGVTMSFYAFVAASPFIFNDVLHVSPERFGLAYFLMISGYSVGTLIAMRMIGRMSGRRLIRISSLVALAGSAVFLGYVLSGELTLAATIVTMIVYNAGAGVASPMALAGAISAQPRAVGAASGLYGFGQMAFGALCTIIVSLGAGSPALWAAIMTCVGTGFGVVCFTLATRDATAAGKSG